MYYENSKLSRRETCFRLCRTFVPVSAGLFHFGRLGLFLSVKLYDSVIFPVPSPDRDYSPGIYPVGIPRGNTPGGKFL